MYRILLVRTRVAYRSRYIAIMNLKCLCVNYCSLHPLSLSTSVRSSSSSSVDEVSSRQNGGRRSVPGTKWLATNCTRDKMAGDENAGDETAATSSVVAVSSSFVAAVSSSQLVVEHVVEIRGQFRN